MAIENVEKKADVPLVISTLESLISKYRHSPRKQNVALIIKAIYEEPGITRKDVAARYKIRPSTVSEIVTQLLQDDLVYEVRPENMTERGRPEIQLYIKKNKWQSIVISCVSREMQALLINSFDEILYRTSVEIPHLADNADIEEYTLKLIRELETANPLPKDSAILCISFSVPGIVDPPGVVWVFSSRWPRMRNLDLGKLRQKTGYDITIKRQLDVQLNYQLVVRPALRSGNTLLFHWGYGIGGAFASKGEIMGSQAGVFCQIGHIAINPDSIKPCICGRMGCLESEAAYWALQPEIERLYPDVIDINEDQAADFLKTHPINDQAFFRKAQRHIVYALSYLQAIFIPDHVLLYGLFLEDPYTLDLLVKKIRHLSPPFVAESMNVEFIKISSSWYARAIAYFPFKKALEEYITSTKSGSVSRIDELEKAID